MNTLDNYEYVYRDEKNKRYRLSRKLFSLAYGSVGEASLTESTLEFMRDIRDEFKETLWTMRRCWKAYVALALPSSTGRVTPSPRSPSPSPSPSPAPRPGFIGFTP